MTAGQLAKIFIGERYNQVCNAVNQLKFQKALTLDHETGIYSLKEELIAYYKGEELPPKKLDEITTPNFKPLSLARFSFVAHLREPIRQMSFKTLG